MMEDEFPVFPYGNEVVLQKQPYFIIITFVYQEAAASDL